MAEKNPENVLEDARHADPGTLTHPEDLTRAAHECVGAAWDDLIAAGHRFNGAGYKADHGDERWAGEALGAAQTALRGIAWLGAGVVYALLSRKGGK